MILGSIRNTKRVELMHLNFKKFFDFLREHDLFELEHGTYELDGEDLIIINTEIEGKNASEVYLEGHKKYVDIQVLLEGRESIGWKTKCEANEIYKPYDEERDVAFYSDEVDGTVDLHAGQFVVLFPEDLHAPGIGEGAIRKVIAKVKVK